MCDNMTIADKQHTVVVVDKHVSTTQQIKILSNTCWSNRNKQTLQTLLICLPSPSLGSFFKETHNTSLSDDDPSFGGVSVRQTMYDDA